jgi:hypothetical protein
MLMQKRELNELKAMSQLPPCHLLGRQPAEAEGVGSGIRQPGALKS